MAIVLVPLAVATLHAGSGCGPNSHYSLLRAMSHGRLTIGRYQWQTCDKAYYHHHFYSVKAPGMDFLAFPVYAGLRAVGLEHEHLPSAHSIAAVGDDLRGGIWPVSLWVVLLPLALLLLLVRRLVDRLEPGFGTIAALTVGVASLALPFAISLFSHDLSALLGLAAFAVLWRERRGPPSLRLVLAAAVLAGYGIVTEYPLGIVAAILGAYALSRPERRRERGSSISAASSRRSSRWRSTTCSRSARSRTCPTAGR